MEIGFLANLEQDEKKTNEKFKIGFKTCPEAKWGEVILHNFWPGDASYRNAEFVVQNRKDEAGIDEVLLKEVKDAVQWRENLFIAVGTYRYPAYYGGSKTNY